MNFNDFNEITCRRYQYAQGIDTKDFDLLRSVFTDQITMDFFDYNGQNLKKAASSDKKSTGFLHNPLTIL